MAAKKQAAKVRSAASQASPYVQRVVEDAELRDNMRIAYENTRRAYGRLTNGKPATKVLDDKKLHKELKQAAEALRDSAYAIREGPRPKKRRGGLVKLLFVGLIGAGLALAFSENLRNKALDALFGAEEEFDYTSTTAPASTPEGETISS